MKGNWSKVMRAASKLINAKKGAMGFDQSLEVVGVLLVLTIFIALGAIMLAQFGSLSVVTSDLNATTIINTGKAGLLTFSNFLTLFYVVGAIVILLAAIMIVVGIVRRQQG